ncbi:GNAT family N-acetyltransferase [Primorskyibacter sp. S187A]|uniref:GNAT family N-acetyltransferase n=1 Tax=Primorskyibacter sp. S187A TaxID=3415130 RepID=UPI003C7D4E4C
MTSGLTIRQAGAEDMAEVARLMQAYKVSLGLGIFDNPGQKADEVLPGPYADRGAGILLAAQDGRALGVVAFKGIAPGVSEMKRMYVAPEGRGLGAGRALALAVMQAAREAGHTRMVLDTLASLTVARSLYESLGFALIPRYNDNPVEGVVFYGCDL